MNGRSKCLSGQVLPPSQELIQFWKHKEMAWEKVQGIQEVRLNSCFFFFQKRFNYSGRMTGDIVMKKTDMFKTSDSYFGGMMNLWIFLGVI